jgi:hypothetical protein
MRTFLSLPNVHKKSEMGSAAMKPTRMHYGSGSDRGESEGREDEEARKINAAVLSYVSHGASAIFSYDSSCPNAVQFHAAMLDVNPTSGLQFPSHGVSAIQPVSD